MKTCHRITSRLLSLTILLSVYLTGTAFGQNSHSTRENAVSFSPSPDFSITIDRKNVLVYSSPIPASFCSFTLIKPVEIKIKSLTRDIKWVDLRPLSSGIKPVFKDSDSTITFIISKPGQFSIELNGSLKTPLWLFANAPEKNQRI